MSLSTTLVFGRDQVCTTHENAWRAADGIQRVIGVVQIGYSDCLTIQSHEPGQLTRLAAALIAAEREADDKRRELGLPTSDEPELSATSPIEVTA